MTEHFTTGEYLTDELRARGWGMGDFLSKMNTCQEVIEKVIFLVADETPAMLTIVARDLGIVFGTSPDLWLNLLLADRYGHEMDEA